MIEHVQAYSRLDALKFTLGRHPDVATLTRRFQNRIAWIGISDSGVSPVSTLTCPHEVLAFVDVNQDEYPHSTFANTMTRRHAERIIALVQRLMVHSEAWALLVHCEKGVGRSGAVAEWVQHRFGVMRSALYEELHTQCIPNPYVMRLLDEEGGFVPRTAHPPLD